jgi:hypothetical protein
VWFVRRAVVFSFRVMLVVIGGNLVARAPPPSLFLRRFSRMTGELLFPAIGDLNGDSRPDLAVANDGANTVSVLLGNGNGTFGAKVDYGTGIIPRSVAIGDVNGDTRPDLAVANASSGTVSVLLGNGNGTFGAKVDYGTGISPRSVAIADVNGHSRVVLPWRTTAPTRCRCFWATATARSPRRSTTAPGSLPDRWRSGT